MAKRFIQSELLRNPWLRVGSTLDKLLWVGMITECDNAGIWIVDWQMMELLVGAPIDQDAAAQFFQGRFLSIDGGRRWFFPDFIRFQYPKGILGESPNFISIRRQFEKYGIDPENLTLTQGLPNPYPRVTPTLMDKDKDIDKGLDTGTVGGSTMVMSSNTQLSGENENLRFGHRMKPEEFRAALSDFRQVYNDTDGETKTGNAYREAVEVLMGQGWEFNQAAKMLRDKAAEYRAFLQATTRQKMDAKNWLGSRAWENDYHAKLKEERNRRIENGNHKNNNRGSGNPIGNALSEIAASSEL